MRFCQATFRDALASDRLFTYGVHMVTPTEAIAAVVRDLMERADESVKHLAETAHIPRATLVRRLAGKTPFTIPELEDVATVLGTTVAEILTLAETSRVA